MKRLFTLDEARALLPRVRALALAMRARKAEFERHQQALAILGREADATHAAHGEAVARHRASVEAIAADIQGMIEEASALGVEVKGIDQGLLDFPAERDGRVVYLCWMADEPDISYWHDLHTGFRGRQPL